MRRPVPEAGPGPAPQPPRTTRQGVPGPRAAGDVDGFLASVLSESEIMKLNFEFLEMRTIRRARRRRQSEDSQFFSQEGISTRDRGGKRGSGDREQRPPSASEARGSGRNQSRNTSAMVKFLKVRDGRRALDLEGGERRGPGPPASGACEASFRAGACSSSRPLFYSFTPPPPPPMGRSH